MQGGAAADTWSEDWMSPGQKPSRDRRDTSSSRLRQSPPRLTLHPSEWKYTTASLPNPSRNRLLQKLNKENLGKQRGWSQGSAALLPDGQVEATQW